MNWKKEFYRDLEAMGSYVFYIIVAARSLVGMYWPFLAQAAAALAISLIIWQIVKSTTGIKASSHAANGMILIFIINAFYQAWPFAIFTVAFFTVVWYAHMKIRKHTSKEFLIGALNGMVSGGLVVWIAYTVMKIALP